MLFIKSILFVICSVILKRNDYVWFGEGERILSDGRGQEKLY